MHTYGEVITAMVTPFDKNLQLDLPTTQKLVSHLIENGSDSIVVSGTTGESPTLSQQEKLLLFETVRLHSQNKAVITNVGSNNTAESIQFSQEVAKRGLSDGLLLANPYYNKPSQEGLYQHFKAIAESVDLPIMLYNIPGRTAVNLDAETTIRLSEIPNIVAIKESSGNLSQIATVIQHTAPTFSVYSGDDNLTLPILALGGKGVVSVASHITGNRIKEMIRYFKNGDMDEAATIHRKLLPFFEGIFFTANPVPIKNALRLVGMNVGSVRLPLVDLTPEEMVKVHLLLKHIK